jgi:saxitoxin biosynthesis operon SxtJ-like protein
MVPMNKPTRAQVLETFVIFAVVSLLAAILGHRELCFLLALALLFIVLFMKALAEVITRCWLKFSAMLSGISNRIILTLLFYLVLTPIALIYRLFNKDPLHLDTNSSGSFYVERNHSYSKADLGKMW